VAQEILAATPEPTGDLPLLTAEVVQWRYAAATHNAQIGREAMLAEAQKAWAESPTEENWRRLQALIEHSFVDPPMV
jgi:hypothetical protein